MKIKLILIGILFLSNTTNVLGQIYNKQHTYLDALQLKLIVEQNKQNRYSNSDLVAHFYEILSKYGISQDDVDQNIFFEDHTIYLLLKSSSDGDDNQEGLKYNPSEFKTAALSATNLQSSAIGGMANFMAGRFKQEALQVAIHQLFKQIKTREDSILVQSIFPKTFAQIKNLYGTGSSSYYTSDLLLLRQTAEIDLKKLPKNIVLNAAQIFPSIEINPEIKDMLALGSYIVENGKQGQKLDILISEIANENYTPNSKIAQLVNVADIISQALIDKREGNEIWVNPINSLPTTGSALENLEVRYFYGLLYQQLIQIPEFKTYLQSSNPSDVVLVAAKIQNLCKFVNRLNKTYNYAKSKDFLLKSPDEEVKYLQEINETFISFATTVKDVPELNNEAILNDTLLSISQKYITLIAPVLEKDYQKVIPLLIIEFGPLMPKNQKTLRIITFLSQLATVESDADMEALLSAYSLPIGSSSIKRHSNFNLSLNTYVGITGGWETAYGSVENQTQGNIGLSAPIGIATTFFSGHLTTFISFIDLGTIVNQRLNNNNTAYNNLSFEQFFAPGVGLYYNFAELPISVGIHLNAIPNLRTIEYGSGNATVTETNISVTRFNFTLLVDIPLFTLYNTERN